MITEDYVSFETAKLLKKKGFYQDFLSEITPVWKLNGNRTELAFYGCDNYPCETDEWYSAPILQLAMKWLREEKKIGIEVNIIFDLDDDNKWYYEYGFCIIQLSGTYKKFADYDGYKNYEEACEAAIRYTLENLI